MKRILVSVLFCLSFALLSNSNLVSAGQVEYVNENGVEFTSYELTHVSKIGVTELELSVLKEVEKEYYMSIGSDSFYQYTRYVKTVTTKVLMEDGGYETSSEDFEIASSDLEQEVAIALESNNQDLLSDAYPTVEISSFPGIAPMMGGGDISLCPPGHNCEDVGDGNDDPDAVHTQNMTESSIRELHLHVNFDKSENKAHVKTVVKWVVLPTHRLEDLIGISHEYGKWFIERYTANGVQYPDFVGKQTYQKQYYDTRNIDPWGNTYTNTKYYSENNDDCYNHNLSEGLVIKQELVIGEEVTYYDEMPAYQIGYVIRSIELSLEADFIYNGTPGPGEFGEFASSTYHQQRVIEVNWEEIYVTYQPPYISIPLGLIGVNKEYGDGLYTTALIPID